MVKFNTAGIFTDNMVIQRNMPICIYGTAPDNSVVTCQIDAASAEAIAVNGEWQLLLPPVAAGGPYLLEITCSNGECKKIDCVMCGDVWIAGGQSNMELALSQSEMTDEIKACPDIKNVWLYNVPRRPFEHTETKDPKLEACISPDTKWTECKGNDALSFSAVAYYFAHKLAESVDVPIGILNCNWGNTSIVSWMSDETLRTVPKFNNLLDEYYEVEKNLDIKEYDQQFINFLNDVDEFIAIMEKEGAPPNLPFPMPPYGPKSYLRPAGLYNCMLSKIEKYKTMGILWYQGESDAIELRYDVYKQALINFFDFLKKKSNNPNMYLMNVQLAPFGAGWIPGERWQLMCQNQLELSACEKNYAMVTTGDCGYFEIHPPKKREVGERLAFAVLNKCFEKKNIEYCGPLPESAYTQGNEVIISFSHADGGLIIKNSDAGIFEVAGSDGIFYKADLRVNGNIAIISSSAVPEPVYARYAWEVYYNIGIYNTSGLPASLFSIKLNNGKYKLGE